MDGRNDGLLLGETGWLVISLSRDKAVAMAKATIQIDITDVFMRLAEQGWSSQLSISTKDEAKDWEVGRCGVLLKRAGFTIEGYGDTPQEAIKDAFASFRNGMRLLYQEWGE